ncbi:MAG: sugar phosphate isomerase/epimerase [Bacteroidales bacterium]|nr:sugar phosphate isomerase/epimerase [Bacteroidales bacterium]
MRLGLSSYTYTWAVGVPGSLPAKPLSAYDLVDRSARSGLRLIQIADNLPLEMMTVTELVNLRKYAADKGVEIEMGGRGLTPEHTMKCLKAAQSLNSPILRMVIDGAGYEPGLDSVLSVINELLPEFKSRKIKLAIENHDRFKAREFEKIIIRAGSEYVGICLDSVNSMGAGEGFEEVSRILLPYTINLHIKDFTIRRVSHKMGIIIEGAPAGKGMLNIRELLNKLWFTNTCGSAILELWTPPENDISLTIQKESNWADESIKYLKSIIK